MPKLLINSHAMAALHAAAQHPIEGAVQEASGVWAITVSDETFERLARLGLPGETLADTVERVLALAAGAVQ